MVIFESEFGKTTLFSAKITFYSRSIASYWQQKRYWSETADAPFRSFKKLQTTLKKTKDKTN